MATVESLNQEIAERTALFNDARKQGADAAIVEEHKRKLGELKRALGVLHSAGGSKDAGKKKERLLLKTPKVRPLPMQCTTYLELTRQLITGNQGLWTWRDALPRAHRADRERVFHDVRWKLP